MRFAIVRRATVAGAIAALVVGFVAAAAAGGAGEAPGGNQETGHPLKHGTFRIVAARNATGVAATLAVQPVPDFAGGPVGRTVIIDRRLIWHDGRFCDDWVAVLREDAPLDLADPMLSDTQIGPAPENPSGPDHRRNLGVDVLCDGRPFASVAVVDDSVLVAPTPNGATLLVLERTPSPEVVREVQAALREAGHYAGEIDGRMNEATREALSLFAHRAGAAFRLAGTPLTQNLFDRIAGARTTPQGR